MSEQWPEIWACVSAKGETNAVALRWNITDVFRDTRKASVG